MTNVTELELLRHRVAMLEGDSLDHCNIPDLARRECCALDCFLNAGSRAVTKYQLIDWLERKGYDADRAEHCRVRFLVSKLRKRFGLVTDFELVRQGVYRVTNPVGLRLYVDQMQRAAA